MKIHVISIMRNEEDLLPYFLRHYTQFADVIYIFDDNSTDRTAEIAKAEKKVVLLSYPFKRGLDEHDHNACFEDAYKKYSRGVADWVMVVDGDEIIYGRDIIGKLERAKRKGKKIVNTIGYTMISETFPVSKKQIYEELKTGVRDIKFDKPVIFDPSIDISFAMGRHDFGNHHPKLPKGITIWRTNLLLLHYKYISQDFFLKRSVSEFDRRGWDADKKKHAVRRARAIFKGAYEKYLEKVL
jgi:glycosyltransferase involved in cell wall biosynthesis